MTPSIKKSFLLLAVPFLVLSVAFLAHADTPPTITTTIQNAASSTVTTAAIGALVHDHVVIASSTSALVPNGTVDFNRYSNTSCDGTGSTESNVSLINGAADSQAFAMPASGHSFKVHYDGDATNTPADGVCEALTATAALPSISTTLSTTSIMAGDVAHDSATLSNTTSNASGTVAYKVYTNNSCTTGVIDAGVKNVTNGSVLDSNSLTFMNAGTYYWQAVYSGDNQNGSASSTCGSEILTVTATSTPPPATTTNGVVSGTVFNDLNTNGTYESGTDQGISGWTVVLYNGSNNSGTVVGSTTTAGGGNGGYTFSNLPLGSYFVTEVTPAGWTQTTPDMAVTLTTNNGTVFINFANTQASSTATTTPPGNGGGDDQDGDDDGDNDNGHGDHGNGHGNGHGNHDGDDNHGNDHDNGNGHDNGNHNGWFKKLFWDGFPFTKNNNPKTILKNIFDKNWDD